MALCAHAGCGERLDIPAHLAGLGLTCPAHTVLPERTHDPVAERLMAARAKEVRLSWTPPPRAVPVYARPHEPLDDALVDEFLSECAERGVDLVVGSHAPARATQVAWRYAYLLSASGGFTARAIAAGTEADTLAEASYADFRTRTAAQEALSVTGKAAVLVDGVMAGAYRSEQARFAAWSRLADDVARANAPLIVVTGGGVDARPWASSALATWVGSRAASILQTRPCEVVPM